jgi:hypothetical protein
MLLVFMNVITQAYMEWDDGKIFWQYIYMYMYWQ